jgi:hypothetical protein
MAHTSTKLAHPPLGLDPENHLMQRESLARVLGELRRHRFGRAFLHRALDERPWQELAADIGVEPNTLTKAWTRLIERIRGDAGDGDHHG